MFKIVRNTGSLFKSRLIIKGFKTLEARNKFVDADRGNWLDAAEYASGHFNNYKPGTYAFVGQQWVNVKALDASVLAHV